MTVREIRQSPGGPQDASSSRRFAVLGRASNIIFTVLFAGLILAYTVQVSTRASFAGIHVAYLLILLFIALIFQRTVLTELILHLRERRHGKA